MSSTYRMKGALERRAMHKPGAKRELFYVVLYLTDALEKKLTFGRNGRLRIEGELEGHPIALALQPSPGKNHYLMVSKKLLESIGALVGDTVNLKFSLADPNHVDVPAELRRAIGTSKALQKKWDALTPGKQRTWAVYVDRVKRPETRLAKANEVADRVRRGLLNPRDPWP
ncbi:MAG: YdeI/OmpD-associated family protein [Myxococcota bacterium]